MSFYVDRGQLIARKWPRKRPLKKGSPTAMWADYFGQINKMFKYLHPIEWAGWHHTAQKGRLYPRDLYTAANMGRGFAIETEDGKLIMPTRAVYDVSKTIDLIGDRTGSILYRDVDEWHALEAGPLDHVLTSQGPDQPLLWAPPSGGGGGGGGWPTFEPLNLWTSESSAHGHTSQASIDGGWIFSLPAVPAGNNWGYLEFTPDWDGTEVTIGLEPWMEQETDCTITLRCMKTDNSYSCGNVIKFRRFDDHKIAALLNAGNVGNTTDFNASKLFNSGRVYFRMQKIGNEVHISDGPSLELIRLRYTAVLGGDHADFKKLAMTIWTRQGNAGQNAFRLFYSDFGA